MSKSFKVDLTGKKFGRLTVIEFVPNEKKNSFWRCKCDCGRETEVLGRNLKNGNTQSCGCLNRDNALHKCEKFKRHNLYKTRLYSIWQGMKKRCYNSNCKRYEDYGGRGISICDEWKKEFRAFYDWAMANGYREELTIDRIDNDKGYNPENCHWTDKKTQNRNTRRNIIVEYQGNKMCMSEAAEQANINYKVVKARYSRGDRGERLFRPIDKQK